MANPRAKVEVRHYLKDLEKEAIDRRPHRERRKGLVHEPILLVQGLLGTPHWLQLHLEPAVDR
jgi:hypothetical protein